jgi:hypothetical protein
MELKNYDEETGAVTITFKKMEFISVHSVISGVVSSYKFQDPRIIDVPPEELKDLYRGLGAILTHLVSTIRK